MQDLGLTQKQFLSVLEQVEALYGHTDCIDLASRTVDLISSLTRADRVMFAITDHPSGRCAAAFWPVGTDLPNFMPLYEPLWRQNPVGQRYGDADHCDVARVSDCISHSELERTEFYNEYMQPAHLSAYMTGYMGPTDGYRLALTAFRERGDFTVQERNRLEIIRRHVVRAFRTSITLGKATGRPVRAHDLLEHPSLPGGHVIRERHGPFRSLMTKQHLTPKLSRRESEVLHWVCNGKTNPEIGLILGCSARTVQKHMEHIFQKLDVTSRTAAGMEAVRLGFHAPTVA
jgi:DNA-binding CsgD family transcriptional regulator